MVVLLYSGLSIGWVCSVCGLILGNGPGMRATSQGSTTAAPMAKRIIFNGLTIWRLLLL